MFLEYPMLPNGHLDVPMALVASSELDALREARLICPDGFELWDDAKRIVREALPAQPN